MHSYKEHTIERTANLNTGRDRKSTGGEDVLSVKNMFIDRIPDEIDSSQFDMAMCSISLLHSQITSMGILSYYLLDRRARGIYISITRPYFYIERLLLKKNIPLTALRSIDALGRDLEGNIDQKNVRSSLLCERLSSKVREMLEKDPTIQFILIDNISGLIPYASPTSIVQFIDDIHEMMMVRSSLQVIMLVDHEVDEMVIKGIQGLCDRHIEISSGMLR
jgi:hypothetical protein